MAPYRYWAFGVLVAARFTVRAIELKCVINSPAPVVMFHRVRPIFMAAAARAKHNDAHPFLPHGTQK